MGSFSLSNKRILLLFSIVWIPWFGLHSLAMHYLGWSWEVSATDSIVSNLLLLTVCFATVNALRFYTPGKSNWQNMLGFSLILVTVYLIALHFSLDHLFEKNSEYLVFLSRSLPFRFGLAFLMIGWVILLVWLWRYISNQQELDQRRVDSENLVKEAELNNLRQQLQPHFLFNSLNSISALVVTRPQEARKMIQQLSDFLRGTLKKEEHQQVSLEEELLQLGLYLEIEKVRFGHRLNTHVEAPENSTDYKLPALLLQPVVENAIKFGLYDTTEAVTISIRASVVADSLQISVRNPFDPQTSQPRSGTGFGLKSIERRLYLLYARNDLLSTSAEGDQFITTLKIPQIL